MSCFIRQRQAINMQLNKDGLWIFPAYFCVCFKLLTLNFIEYVYLITMHYIIPDNFDQVYAFWEIGSLVYMKMLAYRSEETLIRKELFNFKSYGFFVSYDNNQNESTQFKKKIIGKFCKLSFKLALVLKSELLWYIEANYLSTVTPFC